VATSARAWTSSQQTKKPPGDSFKDGSYDPSRIDALLKGRRLTKH